MAADAGTIFSEVRIEIDKLSGDIKRVETKLDQFAKNSQNRSDAVKKNWTSSFKEISLAGVASFAAITLAAKKSITTFSTFEQSLANVQSVARATPEEFAKIEEAAREAGETTKFSATEAADALYSLASAGLDAAEATAALDGVLKLAGATGSDLAFTSATVTAALSQFGLEADQSTEVANTFAAAIGNSQANMQKLATSLRQVGPVAGSLGISLEKTIGPLQALFDAGFQGEQAGTALRNILSSLANEVDPTVRKLEELGLRFEDLNPQVNDIADVIGTLADANLTAGEVIGAFGREAGPQLLSLLEVGRDGLLEYTSAITDTQAAAEAYEIQMNTLQGDLAELRSATESVAISFVQEFAPAIRAGIDVLTAIVRAVNRLPGPVKIFLGILLGGIPLVAGLATAITTLAGAIGALLGPVTLVVAGIAGLVAVVVAVARASDTAARSQERLQETSDQLKKTIDEYRQVTQDLEKALAEGNIEEAKTLKLRQELLKTTLAANLREDVKALQALAREEEKQRKALDRLNNEVEIATDFTRQYEQALQDQIRSGNANSETARFYTAALKENNIQVLDVTERMLDQKAVVDELVLSRQQEIDTLAAAINAGNLELSLIKSYSAALAEEVFLRAQKLKAQEDNKAATDDETQSVEELEEKQRQQAKAERDSEKLAREAAEKRKAANEAAAETVVDYTEKLEDLGATELELIELQRQRAIAEVQNSDASVAAQEKAIASINKYFDALVEQKSALADITAETESYELQLLKLVGTEEEIIEAERARAIATTRASGASTEAIEKQIEAINALYDQLISTTASSLEIWLDENKKFIDAAFGLFDDLFSAIDEKAKSSADKQISDINRILEAELQAIDDRLQAELESRGLAEESKLESLERELNEAIEKGDQEVAETLRKEIEKTKILEQYEGERTAAEEDARRKSAQIEYQAALTSWKIRVAEAIASAAAAIVNIWATWGKFPLVAAGLTAGTVGITAAQISAINDAKPEPPSFQTGGIVIPSGSGGRQVTVAENGSPELLLNAGREGESFLNDFARRVAAIIIPQIRGGGVVNLMLNIDGRRVAESSAQYYNNGQVRIDI